MFIVVFYHLFKKQKCDVKSLLDKGFSAAQQFGMFSVDVRFVAPLCSFKFSYCHPENKQGLTKRRH